MVGKGAKGNRGKKAVLIIKHGFSETCDHKISPIVSYGDVFRCTCLLESFKDCQVNGTVGKKSPY